MIALNQGATVAASVFAKVRDNAPFGDAIPPGATATTLLIFDIPADAFPLTLTFVPAHRDVKIDECSCSLPAPGDRTGTN